jgi:hypothetical protein
MEKTGRNDPCPCGSGKKYKKCHGAPPELKPPTSQKGPATQKSKRLREIADKTPYTSLGRETVASRVGRSLVPVGLLPFEPVKWTKEEGVPAITQDHPDFEKLLMNIVGTAIQADTGKLVTCAHVVQGLLKAHPTSRHYILARMFRGTEIMFMPYPIQVSVKYLDPRTDSANDTVDLALLLSSPNTDKLAYEVPNVTFGDSGQLGVGDPVVVGGYPHGKEMFLFTKTNRGLIQPTFYAGIVSAILPASTPTETRLIQISVPVAGGMSGGAVFLPETGEVVGMVTSCVHMGDIPQPMSYAIPSEIIAPYVELVTFGTDRNKRVKPN